MFGLRRLRGNPPCSLWLQSVHWTNCFTRRAHIPVPPCKGTHGDRVAGDNTRSRHNLRQFSHCATSLCAPATQQHGAVACTLRQVRRSIRSPPCGSNGEDGRHSHRKVSCTHYATRSQVQRTTRTCSLVQPSCSALICSPPLRLVFRL